MSRKDTIIIAVLVNAGLLMALFATAMRSNKKQEAKAQLEIAVAEKTESVANETMPLAQAENILDATIGGAVLDETSSDMLGEEIDIASLTPTVAEVPSEVAAEPAPAKLSETPAIALEAKTQDPSTITVTVKKGDVLEKIARHNGSTVALIMKANNLSSTNLKIGQVLKVPQKDKKDSTSASIAKTESKEAEYYTVKEGDSPWLIASRNKVKLDDLLRLNSMDEQKAKRLRPGDKLRIR